MIERAGGGIRADIFSGAIHDLIPDPPREAKDRWFPET
jgi:hypothetical protein